MKKIILLCLALFLLSTSYISASAAPAFVDIEEHWAKNEIKELTELKIINGYDDTTFGPEDPVIRADALLLASRVIGCNDIERSEFLEIANIKNYEQLKTLGYKNYEKTLSFLIYNDIYTFDEISKFLGNKQGDNNLKRVEAAEILVKILGKTSEADKLKTSLKYADASQIPSSKRGFVAYCQNEGLMKGMEDNKFCPDEPVTRAQMATILHRILKSVTTVYSTGTITEVNSINDTLKYVEQDGTKKTLQNVKNFKKKFEGNTITSVDTIKIGDIINVVYKNDSIAIIEFLSNPNSETIFGEYEGAIVTKNTQKIKMKSDSDKVSHTYLLDPKCAVTINGNNGNVSELSTGDFITITLISDTVTSIVSENYHETRSGHINKIVISSSPTFTVSSNGKNIECDFLDKDINILLDGEKADIYDLRLGYSAEIKLFNSEITDVIIKSKVIEEVTDYVSGTIKYVDNKFNYIILMDMDGEEKQIFFNDDTEIYDTNKNDRELTSDLIGSTIKTLFVANEYNVVADEIVIVIVEE